MVKAYSYKGKKGTYYLHAREVGKGKIFYFSKKIKKGAVSELPEDKEIVILPSGLPALKNK